MRKKTILAALLLINQNFLTSAPEKQSSTTNKSTKALEDYNPKTFVASSIICILAAIQTYLSYQTSCANKKICELLKKQLLLLPTKNKKLNFNCTKLLIDYVPSPYSKSLTLKLRMVDESSMKHAYVEFEFSPQTNNDLSEIYLSLKMPDNSVYTHKINEQEKLKAIVENKAIKELTHFRNFSTPNQSLNEEMLYYNYLILLEEMLICALLNQGSEIPVLNTLGEKDGHTCINNEVVSKVRDLFDFSLENSIYSRVIKEIVSVLVQLTTASNH